MTAYTVQSASAEASRSSGNSPTEPRVHQPGAGNHTVCDTEVSTVSDPLCRAGENGASVGGDILSRGIEDPGPNAVWYPSGEGQLHSGSLYHATVTYGYTMPY